MEVEGATFTQWIALHRGLAFSLIQKSTQPHSEGDGRRKEINKQFSNSLNKDPTFQAGRWPVSLSHTHGRSLNSGDIFN